MMDSSSDEPMETDDEAAVEEEDADLSSQSESEIPEIERTPPNSAVEVDVDRPVGNEINNPTVNMEIDLVRIQQGMYSPVIILNSLNNRAEAEEPSEPVPPSTNDAEDGVELVQPSTGQQEESDPDNQQIQILTSSPTRHTTPPSKKRKQTISPITDGKAAPYDNDDGLICSICLEEWTITGQHRIVALKCGHLFGMSCIKRWLKDGPAGRAQCATCKARAKLADIRNIYARSVRTKDNSREIELEEQIEMYKKKTMDLKLKLSIVMSELNVMRRNLDSAKRQVKAMQTKENVDKRLANIRIKYQLALVKNVEISREPGCRTLLYVNKHHALLISQKSTQSLFPGYAMRLMQVPEISGKSTSSVIHVSLKPVRDIALDATEDLFACATMEKTVKVFSLLNRSVHCAITPNPNEILWSCAFDRERTNLLYLGSQRGLVYAYDISEPTRMLKEYQVGHFQRDYTAVIKICPVETRSCIPCGGFLVCKLKTVWFYEYTTSEEVLCFQFHITGPLSSMSYNADSGLVLIAIRPTPDTPTSIILGMIKREQDLLTLDILYSFEGSRIQTNMQRSAQVFLNQKDTLVASYMEDSKMLSTWCTGSGTTWVQQLPVEETVLDICPIRGRHGRLFLATLTDCRCRIYRIIPSIQD